MTSRRQFLKLAGSGAMGLAAQQLLNSAIAKASDFSLADAAPRPVNNATGRVVVVGGGMGGATAAKFLKTWGGAGLQVTLIDRNATYVSNIFSNLVLNGQKTISALQFNYTKLQARGINFIQADVAGIDGVGRNVLLADGRAIAYDRLVLSPGIDFDLIPGLSDYNTIVHAWQAGPQTTLLAQQIQTMRTGGAFVMTIPAAPYRCPPGPYERACLVADYLKRNKPGSKVIVLDANPNVMAERTTFETAFNGQFAGVVEYHPNVVVNSINPSAKSIDTNLGVIAADVLNPIPPHRAGKLVRDAGLANVGGKWAGVDVLSYESSALANVHVIGDASSTTQPKAGHIANAEAKVCADAILHLLAGEPVYQSPVTNSACYSPITNTTASWLTAIYHYDPVTHTMKTPGPIEAASPTSGNYQTMSGWFTNLMNDTFA